MIQKSDTINYDGTSKNIFSQPLEHYFKKSTRPNFNSFKPEMVSRGYFADWLIENNRLYLVNFEGYVLNNWAEELVSRVDLFDSNNNIFADWFTGEINIPYADSDYPIPVNLIKLNFIEGHLISTKK